MLKNLRYGHTLIWFLDKHSSYQALRVLTYRLPAWQVKLKRLSQRHLDCLYWLLMIERKGATEHGISNTAQAPNIASEGIRILL